MNPNDKRQDVLITALDKLKQEIEKEPLSPVRVAALTGAIKVLAEINPVSLKKFL